MSTGALVLCRTLEALGVECVFGLPGTQNVGLFEGLRQSRLRTIVPTSELAAGFMANGYARTSGRVGVVCAIPGPGFTWALTALAEARHDSVPLLLLTGAPEDGRPFALQGLDQSAMAAPVAKGVLRVTALAELSSTVVRAHALALEGEPGPVVVEIPDRLLTADAAGSDDRHVATSVEPLQPDNAQLESLIEKLRQARRVAILAGQGCVAASSQLRDLAERLGAPVATTLSGRGVLPEDHPLALGVEPAGDGIAALNTLFAQADLVLALGCKLSHNGSGGFRLLLPPDRLVHVDTSPGVLNANYRASLPILADVGVLLGKLGTVSLPRGDWTAAELDACRRASHGSSEVSEPAVHGVSPANPAAFFTALRRALPRDAILALDSGLHQMLARKYYRVLAPAGLLLPSDFQSMGYGLPAAIGAALAAPERRVVALIGDGGFAMSGLELSTAVREGLRLVLVVFVDGALGLIRLQQLREFSYEYATRLERLDLSAFALAVGANHVPLGGEGGASLDDAIGLPGVTIIEVSLGDSSAVRRLRVSARARAVARRWVPAGFLEAVKRLFR